MECTRFSYMTEGTTCCEGSLEMVHLDCRAFQSSAVSQLPFSVFFFFDTFFIAQYALEREMASHL